MKGHGEGEGKKGFQKEECCRRACGVLTSQLGSMSSSSRALAAASGPRSAGPGDERTRPSRSGTVVGKRSSSCVENLGLLLDAVRSTSAAAQRSAGGLEAELSRAITGGRPPMPGKSLALSMGSTRDSSWTRARCCRPRGLEVSLRIPMAS